MTADVFIDAPHVLHADTITDCTEATISTITCSTLSAASYISTPVITTNKVSGTGVIIASETGYGITIGTDATEINMTADVFIDAPQLLHVDTITDCASASISTITNISSIIAEPSLSVGAAGTASSILYVDQIAPRGGLVGTTNQFLTTFGNRIIWADTTALNTAPTWSQYPATQTVNFDSQAITGVTQLTTSTITMTALQDSAGQYGTVGQFLGADSTPAPECFLDDMQHPSTIGNARRAELMRPVLKDLLTRP
jgi:hypothetical protein